MPSRPPASRPRSILLSDCDVFYVQLARMADPDGAGREPLLIVGGSAESRGVVCSATYEVRKYGVRSGMPISRAVKLCPQAMCVPVPRELTSQKSEEIYHVLQRFAPDVESASPDEAYMDLTTTMDTVYRGRTLEEIAHMARAAVERETGIRVSMGGGTSKLIAKLAVEPAKPRDGRGGNGVYVVAPGDEAAFVARLELRDIPGIGPRFQEQLAKHGWYAVQDLLDVPREEIERKLGESATQWLWDVMHGVDDSPVHQREEPKSMGREETFARDIMDDRELEIEMLQLVDRVTSDLRESGYAARTITVKIKDSDFKRRSAALTLEEPITTYQAMAPIAKDLLRDLRKKRRVAARLIGITASHLQRLGAEEQLILFAREGPQVETDRQRGLAAAMDSVREKFGRRALKIGVVERE